MPWQTVPHVPLSAPASPSPPKRRYERLTPGELLHLDTKKLARFDRPGQRVTGNVTQSSRRPSYRAQPVAIDDHSRVGFSRILRMKPPEARSLSL